MKEKTNAYRNEFILALKQNMFEMLENVDDEKEAKKSANFFNNNKNLLMSLFTSTYNNKDNDSKSNTYNNVNDANIDSTNICNDNNNCTNSNSSTNKNNSTDKNSNTNKDSSTNNNSVNNNSSNNIVHGEKTNSSDINFYATATEYEKNEKNNKLDDEKKNVPLKNDSENGENKNDENKNDENKNDENKNDENKNDENKNDENKNDENKKWIRHFCWFCSLNLLDEILEKNIYREKIYDYIHDLIYDENTYFDTSSMMSVPYEFARFMLNQFDYNLMHDIKINNCIEEKNNYFEKLCQEKIYKKKCKTVRDFSSSNNSNSSASIKTYHSLNDANGKIIHSLHYINDSKIRKKNKLNNNNNNNSNNNSFYKREDCNGVLNGKNNAVFSENCNDMMGVTCDDIEKGILSEDNVMIDTTTDSTPAIAINNIKVGDNIKIDDNFKINDNNENNYGNNSDRNSDSSELNYKQYKMTQSSYLKNNKNIFKTNVIKYQITNKKASKKKKKKMYNIYNNMYSKYKSFYCDNGKSTDTSSYNDNSNESSDMSNDTKSDGTYQFKREIKRRQTICTRKEHYETINSLYNNEDSIEYSKYFFKKTKRSSSVDSFLRKEKKKKKKKFNLETSTKKINSRFAVHKQTKYDNFYEQEENNNFSTDTQEQEEKKNGLYKNMHENEVYNNLESTEHKEDKEHNKNNMRIYDKYKYNLNYIKKYYYINEKQKKPFPLCLYNILHFEKNIKQCSRCFCFYNITSCHCLQCKKKYNILLKNPHYFIFQHGLTASVVDFQNMINYLLLTNPNLFAYITYSNQSHTFEGIDVGTERLCTELMCLFNVINDKINISMVGHSLGGILNRSVISKLYRKKVFKKKKLINFITFACPHVGVHENMAIFKSLSSYLYSHTIDDLNNKTTVLLRIATIESINVLKQFKNIIFYGNSQSDWLVGTRTSLILPYTIFKDDLLMFIVEQSRNALEIPINIFSVVHLYMRKKKLLFFYFYQDSYNHIYDSTNQKTKQNKFFNQMLQTIMFSSKILPKKQTKKFNDFVSNTLGNGRVNGSIRSSVSSGSSGSSRSSVLSGYSGSSGSSGSSRSSVLSGSSRSSVLSGSSTSSTSINNKLDKQVQVHEYEKEQRMEQEPEKGSKHTKTHELTEINKKNTQEEKSNSIWDIFYNTSSFEKLPQLFMKSNTNSVNVTGSTDNVTGSTDNVTRATNNVTGSTNNVTGSTDNVTGSTDNVTGSADNVTGSTDNVTGSTDNVTSAIDNVTSSTDNASGDNIHNVECHNTNEIEDKISTLQYGINVQPFPIRLRKNVKILKKKKQVNRKSSTDYIINRMNKIMNKKKSCIHDYISKYRSKEWYNYSYNSSINRIENSYTKSNIKCNRNRYNKASNKANNKASNKANNKASNKVSYSNLTQPILNILEKSIVTNNKVYKNWEQKNEFSNTINNTTQINNENNFHDKCPNIQESCKIIEDLSEINKNQTYISNTCEYTNSITNEHVKNDESTKNKQNNNTYSKDGSNITHTYLNNSFKYNNKATVVNDSVPLNESNCTNNIKNKNVKDTKETHNIQVTNSLDEEKKKKCEYKEFEKIFFKCLKSKIMNDIKALDKNLKKKKKKEETEQNKSFFIQNTINLIKNYKIIDYIKNIGNTNESDGAKNSSTVSISDSTSTAINKKEIETLSLNKHGCSNNKNRNNYNSNKEEQNKYTCKHKIKNGSNNSKNSNNNKRELIDSSYTNDNNTTGFSDTKNEYYNYINKFFDTSSDDSLPTNNNMCCMNTQTNNNSNSNNNNSSNNICNGSNIKKLKKNNLLKGITKYDKKKYQRILLHIYSISNEQLLDRFLKNHDLLYYEVLFYCLNELTIQRYCISYPLYANAHVQIIAHPRITSEESPIVKHFTEHVIF
ncbi:serine esterase, putative [Hepatocystis sp. ex Piliocolobus tephrosceles]|nr:serine esterase, putative [Hepatocystis sp. ex Piliocolobus tephrosceles]